MAKALLVHERKLMAEMGSDYAPPGGERPAVAAREYLEFALGRIADCPAAR